MRSRQRGIVKVCQWIGGDSHQKRLTLKWLSHPPVGGPGCLLVVPSMEVSKSSLSPMQSPSLGATLPWGPLFLRHVSFFPLPFFHFFHFRPLLSPMRKMSRTTLKRAWHRAQLSPRACEVMPMRHTPTRVLPWPPVVDRALISSLLFSLDVGFYVSAK